MLFQSWSFVKKRASDFPASDSEQREATFGFISSSDFLFCFYSQRRGERFLFQESSLLLGENKENHFHSNMLFFGERLQMVNFPPLHKKSRGCSDLRTEHMRRIIT